MSQIDRTEGASETAASAEHKKSGIVDIRLLCSFVEPQPVGERFTRPDWPLHVAVVPLVQVEIFGK